MKIYLPFLLLLVFNFSFSQKDVTVKGTVVEQGSNYPLEYATITFTSKSDNKTVTGGITDSEGKFNVDLESGVYDIAVEYISYKTKNYYNKTISEDINLGTVALDLDIESLDEVEIVAESTTVEIKLDKKVYNIGKDLTTAGGTVSDALKSMRENANKILFIVK